MIKGRNLIVLSDDWGRHPFSCEHIIKRFLPYNRIMWVNTIGYRTIQINRYDFERAYGKIMSWLMNTANRQHASDNGPLVLNPVCIPFGGIHAARVFNTWSVTRMVRRTAKQYRISDPIVITTLPTAVDFVGNLGETRAVYYCVDDFTQWPGVQGDLMLSMESQLLRKVDLIIATSEKLRETRSNGIRPTQLLTHGVDAEHFRDIEKTMPNKAVRNLKQPVVAYYGLIDERCDLALVRNLATTMPGVTFLIIGQWRVDPGDLAVFPNVRIIGPVAYNDLPAYLAPANALILPYVINGLADSINPLKLKEYIATGLPVVATPLPEVVKLNKFVSIARENTSFAQSLADALKSPQRNDPEIDEFLRENSWDAKADEFSCMIEKVL